MNHDPWGARPGIVDPPPPPFSTEKLQRSREAKGAAPGGAVSHGVLNLWQPDFLRFGSRIKRHE